MKIRFLSSVPCALTIGGEYFGITDDFERFAEISLKDNLFACFSPQNALPLGVFLNDRLFFSPPEGVEAYLLRDGAALYARDFPPRSSEVRITAQERFVSDLITVYFQGGLHVSLETAKGFSVAPLAHYYEHATIKKRDGLFFIEGNNALCIFNARGKNFSTEKFFRIARRKARYIRSHLSVRARHCLVSANKRTDRARAERKRATNRFCTTNGP